MINIIYQSSIIVLQNVSYKSVNDYVMSNISFKTTLKTFQFTMVYVISNCFINSVVKADVRNKLHSKFCTNNYEKSLHFGGP